MSAAVRPTRRMCSPVSSSRYSAAKGEALQRLAVRGLELCGSFGDSLLECSVLLLDLSVKEPRVHEVANAQRHLGDVERLGEEVGRAGGEGPKPRLGRRVGGQDDDR